MRERIIVEERVGRVEGGEGLGRGRVIGGVFYGEGEGMLWGKGEGILWREGGCPDRTSPSAGQPTEGDAATPSSP